MEDAGEEAKNAEGDVDEQGAAAPDDCDEDCDDDGEGDVDEQGAAAPVHDEDGEGGEEEGGDEGDL